MYKKPQSKMRRFGHQLNVQVDEHNNMMQIERKSQVFSPLSAQDLDQDVDKIDGFLMS